MASSLKVFVEAEVAGGNWCRRGSRACVRLLLLLGSLVETSHDTSLLVVTNALLEEVCLASQRDVLHEVEGVGGVVDLAVAKSEEQPVGDELDVLAHKIRVHTQKPDGKSVCQELLLNSDGLLDDLPHGLVRRLVFDVREQQACKVSVHTLVTGDELVGKGETRHETALLEPEDRGECAAEEYALDGGEGYQPLSKSRAGIVDPSYGPIGLLPDTRNWLGNG